jgi:hypothetical protein
MKLAKPTESLLNVTEATRLSYGPHKAILVDPTAGTVTFGWHSPAGHDSDSLSFTGGLLTPSEDHKYNETVIPLSDEAAVKAQARKLNISLTREIETPEYLEAVARREQAAARRRALLDGRKAIVVDWEPEHPAVRAAMATAITEWELVEETDKEISRYAVIDGLIIEQVEEDGEEPKIERVWMAA